MTRPNLILLKTLEVPHDEVDVEFTRFKDSLPEDTQLSMFDIIVHDEGEVWFREAIKLMEEGNKDDQCFVSLYNYCSNLRSYEKQQYNVDDFISQQRLYYWYVSWTYLFVFLKIGVFMTLGIWILYVHITIYGGSSNAPSTMITQKFNTKEDCLNNGNVLIKKFSDAHRVKTVCVESNL